jgi:hypothetical protein
MLCQASLLKIASTNSVSVQTATLVHRLSSRTVLLGK